MTGIRKQQKIETLKKLNRIYELGMNDSLIEEYSTAQLKKEIYKVKREKGLAISSLTKVPTEWRT